jgi:hypothetical protein
MTPFQRYRTIFRICHEPATVGIVLGEAVAALIAILSEAPKVGG